MCYVCMGQYSHDFLSSSLCLHAVVLFPSFLSTGGCSITLSLPYTLSQGALLAFTVFFILLCDTVILKFSPSALELSIHLQNRPLNVLSRLIHHSYMCVHTSSLPFPDDTQGRSP